MFVVYKNFFSDPDQPNPTFKMDSYFQYVHNLKGDSKFDKLGPGS